ncbi:MAG: hypothetical protein DMG24_10075 [Acidobacteria bacterium]|nr:MAG: hypothetical protein DMG24_10075 [Acidobacteriota bacterium]
MAGLNQRLSIGIGILLAVIGAWGARAQVKTDGPRSLGEKPLLLRDFKPTSMLHAPVHNVYRARFPVIDVHNHVNDARSAGREHTPPARVVEVMDRCNIQTIVILTGEWGDRLQRVLDEMVKPYPGRFMVFTQIDWSKIDDPSFAQEMVGQIDDAVARGARGLKVLKDFGLEVRYKSGRLLALDDPRLDPIWAECGRLGIPVSIHVTDPEAFFHPVDQYNERYEELLAHPDWSFYGPRFPSKEAILEARDRVFARHPNTTFISLHVANWPENLDYVSHLLDRCPNVMVEFGAREAELGPGGFSSSTRTESVSELTRRRARPCIETTCAGSRPRTNTLTIGAIRARAAGKSTGCICRAEFLKRFII